MVLWDRKQIGLWWAVPLLPIVWAGDWQLHSLGDWCLQGGGGGESPHGLLSFLRFSQAFNNMAVDLQREKLPS